MEDIIDSAYVNVVLFLYAFQKTQKEVSYKTKSHFKEPFFFYLE